jgi:hypothetical protein
VSDTPFYWHSADGLSCGEIRSLRPEPPYPAMVSIEIGGPGGSVRITVLPRDAEDLAASIGAAADLATLEMRRLAATTKADT